MLKRDIDKVAAIRLSGSLMGTGPRMRVWRVTINWSWHAEGFLGQGFWEKARHQLSSWCLAAAPVLQGALADTRSPYICLPVWADSTETAWLQIKAARNAKFPDVSINGHVSFLNLPVIFIFWLGDIRLTKCASQFTLKTVLVALPRCCGQDRRPQTVPSSVSSAVLKDLGTDSSLLSSVHESSHPVPLCSDNCWLQDKQHPFKELL